MHISWGLLPSTAYRHTVNIVLHSSVMVGQWTYDYWSLVRSLVSPLPYNTGQLSLPSLWSLQTEYQLWPWKGGNVTSAGWQIQYEMWVSLAVRVVANCCTILYQFTLTFNTSLEQGQKRLHKCHMDEYCWTPQKNLGHFWRECVTRYALMYFWSMLHSLPSYVLVVRLPTNRHECTFFHNF